MELTLPSIKPLIHCASFFSAKSVLIPEVCKASISLCSNEMSSNTNNNNMPVLPVRLPATRQSSSLSNLQGRYWLLTVPARDWAVPQELADPVLVYIKGQKEVGAGGYEHWQLMVISTKCRGTKIKSLFGNTAHVELSRSEAAAAYVWKDETRVAGSQFELGEKPINRVSFMECIEIEDI